MSGAIPAGARPLAIASAIGIAALALWLRLHWGDYPLGFDELASLYYAHRPFALLWSGWMVRETNPPLFYSLLRLWIGIGGGSYAAVRLFPILIGLASIGVAFAGARRLYGPRAGAYAAILLTLSAQHIYHSFTVRGYILAFAAALVSAIGLLQFAETIADRHRRRRGLALYAGGALAAIYCHTTMFVWPAAAMLALAMLFRARLLDRGLLAELALANLLLAAASAWWLAITLQQMHGANIEWVKPLGIRAAAALFLCNDFLLRVNTRAELLATLPVAALAGWGIVATWRSAATRLGLLAMAAAMMLLFVLGLRQPILLPRTVYWLTVFPLLFVAAGLSRIPGRWAGPAIAAALSLGLIADAGETLATRADEGWRPVVRRVAGDAHAVLLLRDEAMSVALDTACAQELHAAHCPFPIFAFRGGGRHFDTWGDGLARQPPGDLAGYLDQPETHVYIYRRMYHDLLDDLHCAGLLTAIPHDSPALAGPLPPAALRPLAEGKLAARCVAPS